MKCLVELISLLSKFFVVSPGLLYHLIRRDTGQLTNEAFTSNPIVSSKQYLSGLKITNWNIADDRAVKICGKQPEKFMWV